MSTPRRVAPRRATALAWLALAGPLALVGAPASAAPLEPQASGFPAPALPSPRDFPIMSWDDTPADDAQLALMREAGLNMAGFCRAGDLARVQAAGMGCLLVDDRLRALVGSHETDPRRIDAELARLAPLARPGGPVLGVFLDDEPHGADLPALGALVRGVHARLPGILPFVNLFPYRTGQREWYTDYHDYVEALVAAGAPFLSFDNYALSYAGMGEEFYENLELVRSSALAHHLPFWACLQSVAHFGYLEPGDATLRLQVWSALAYGARGIEYFTYFTPQRGNYRLAPVDPFGHRTATWDAMRRVNGELHALAPLLLQLASTGVFHYPAPPPHGQPLAASRLLRGVQMEKDEDAFVPPVVEPSFLVGEFRDARGRDYLLLVNRDLVHSFRYTLEFRGGDRTAWRINPYTGAEEPMDHEQPWLAPGGGALLRIE